MSKRTYRQLSSCCKYAEKRISAISVSTENYITTDNMLPHRKGVETAKSVPDSKTFHRYDPEDILISNIRPYFQKIWFANKIGGCSADVLVLETNDSVNKKFLYYVLSDSNFFNYATVTSKGTKMPRGTKSAIMRYLVPDISLSAQKQIADILSAYDDLIENNLARISLLEKMASELYKEWFVRFRFPGHEAAKFVDGVPKGWEYHKLKDIADIVMGQSPKSSYYNSDGEGLPFHQGVTNYGRRYVSNVEYCSVGKRYALPNSILFSVRAPVGRINLTREKVIIGRGLSALNHKLGKQSYLFYLLKSHFSVEDMIGNGSVFSSVTKPELEKQKLLIPPSNLIEMFSQIVEPMDDMINCLDMQVEMLRKTRDLLLPRLMNGKLSVEPLLSETA